MRKTLILLVLGAILLAGCASEGGTASRTAQNASGVDQVLKARMEEEQKTIPEPSENKTASKDKTAEEGNNGNSFNEELPEYTEADLSGNISSTDDPENGDNVYDPGTEDIFKTDPDSGADDTAKKGSQTEVMPSETIDTDLTVLSANMVYAEVYNMMMSPDYYVGKTVKMGGIFASYHDDETGKDYFACIIQDATACCAQGIEFELYGEHKYPEDYPPEGDLIEVVGVFDTYEEGGNLYCTLRNAYRTDIAG